MTCLWWCVASVEVRSEREDMWCTLWGSGSEAGSGEDVVVVVVVVRVSVDGDGDWGVVGAGE